MKLAHSLLLTVSLIAGIVAFGHQFWRPQTPVAGKVSEPIHAQKKPFGLSETDKPTAEDGQAIGVSPLRRETKILRGELEALKKELASLRLAVNDLHQHVTSNWTAEETLTADASEDVLEDADAAQDQELEAIESSLGNEQVDTQWSNRAMADIEQALLAQELAETSLIDADCRFTMCRVEVQHADTLAAVKFQGLFSQWRSRAGLQTALVQSNQGDDGNHTVIYLTREGYDLPQADTMQ